VSIKPPEDYFTLFDLLPAYDLDPAVLAVRYRALQRSTHPDRFANASPAERRRAVERTAELNTAFQTLKDPMRRARHLLTLQGVNTDDETDTVMDPGFLMEQMELREQLDDARHLGMSRRNEVLNELARTLSQAISDRSRRFAVALTEDVQCARGIVREMQFLRKLEDEIAKSAEETV